MIFGIATRIYLLKVTAGPVKGTIRGTGKGTVRGTVKGTVLQDFNWTTGLHHILINSKINEKSFFMKVFCYLHLFI